MKFFNLQSICKVMICISNKFSVVVKSPMTFLNIKFTIANKNYHLIILKCCIIIFNVFVFIIEYTASFWFQNIPPTPSFSQQQHGCTPPDAMITVSLSISTLRKRFWHPWGHSEIHCHVHTLWHVSSKMLQAQSVDWTKAVHPKTPNTTTTDFQPAQPPLGHAYDTVLISSFNNILFAEDTDNNDNKDTGFVDKWQTVESHTNEQYFKCKCVAHSQVTGARLSALPDSFWLGCFSSSWLLLFGVQKSGKVVQGFAGLSSVCGSRIVFVGLLCSGQTPSRSDKIPCP